MEVCDLLGVHHDTFDKYQRLGLIPKATYPTRKRRYWQHQVTALVKLFRKMRAEGWPHRMPHFIGSKRWDEYRERLKQEWERDRAGL